ncbi:MAG TPA: hypothetical protein VF264_03205 [Rhodanobacteraceae bacterium]
MNKHLQGTLAVAIAAALAVGGMSLNATAATTKTAATTASMVATNQAAGHNWFGGEVYNGEPALAATAALVKAGGGASHFEFSTALVAMLGKDTVNKEVAKLTKQYGAAEVKTFLSGMTFAVNDGLKRATEAGVKLPAPAAAHGVDLAKALVQAGTTSDGTFWSGYLFDKALSHKLHNQVMGDIDAKFGMATDATTHKLLNQAMFDVAQALAMKNVKLASYH